MSNMYCEKYNGEKREEEEKIQKILQTLPYDRLFFVEEVVEHVVDHFDPDLINTIMKWTADPRLDTLLHNASLLDDETLDQLIFQSEDMVKPFINKQNKNAI